MPIRDESKPTDPNVRYRTIFIPFLLGNTVGVNVKMNTPIESRTNGKGLTFLRQFIAAILPDGIKSISARRAIIAVINIAFGDTWIGNLMMEESVNSLTTGKLTITSFSLPS